MANQSPALDLASWLCGATPRRPDALTHLKLQKLAFYCYGALLAFDLDRQTGKLLFEAWKHGPVCPDIYARYSEFGREPLPRPTRAITYGAQVESVLRDVVNVYGRLAAWQLREESHEELPWQNTFNESERRPIDNESLRAHFRAKFRGPVVAFPERLFGGSSFLLDRIPVPTFLTLAEMSSAATRILGSVD